MHQALLSGDAMLAAGGGLQTDSSAQLAEAMGEHKASLEQTK